MDHFRSWNPLHPSSFPTRPRNGLCACPCLAAALPSQLPNADLAARSPGSPGRAWLPALRGTHSGPDPSQAPFLPLPPLPNSLALSTGHIRVTYGVTPSADNSQVTLLEAGEETTRGWGASGAVRGGQGRRPHVAAAEVIARAQLPPQTVCPFYTFSLCPQGGRRPFRVQAKGSRVKPTQT